MLSFLLFLDKLTRLDVGIQRVSVVFKEFVENPILEIGAVVHDSSIPPLLLIPYSLFDGNKREREREIEQNSNRLVLLNR
jgi:hypothetical protein